MVWSCVCERDFSCAIHRDCRITFSASSPPLSSRSIIRTSGYVTSHTVAVDPLYRLHKKNPEKSREKDRLCPICAEVLACRIPSVKPLHTNIYNAQNIKTARNRLSYYRIVQGKIILQHSYAPEKSGGKKPGDFRRGRHSPQ
jgi:hypothetical protein